jgi:hypothetical protein
VLKPLPTDEEIAKRTQAGDRYRRIAGVAIGAGLGLVFGLVSQSINSIVMPGLPFYQPPFGPVVNAVLCFLGGTLLGLVSAWPHESAPGIVTAGVAGALCIGGLTLATARLDWNSGPGVIVTTLILLLPLSALVVPIVWSLRWAANKQEDSYLAGYFTWSRVLAPLILVMVTGGLAATVLYPPEARPVLARMNAMVRAGLAASDPQALPRPLQSQAMDGFLDHATGAYTLEWTQQLDRYGMIVYSTASPRDQSGVIAHFENGWTFACLFATSEVEPVCKHLQQ